MNYRSLFSGWVRVILLLLVFVAGVGLLAKDSDLAPEGVNRQRALSALAPAGGQADDGPLGKELEGQFLTHEPVVPVVRDMADVVIDTTAGDSMYERWLRGELDLDENESIISQEEKLALQEQAIRNPPDIPVQLAQSGPGPLAPSLGTGFASIDYTQGGGSVPPDPEMAAGPNHLIAVVNVAVAFYDKTGTAVFGPTAASNLFSLLSCKSGLYDPNVIYDEEAGRWFLAYDQGPESASGGYCVLASQTDDPTGLWNEYFFPTNSSSGWLDYPHAGVGDNYIFMGGNIFTIAGSYVEGRIYAFNKADLYAGNPVTMIQQGLGGTIDTPQPLNLHGQTGGTWPSYGDVHYFLGEIYDGRNYPLLRWNPATATLTNLGNIDLGAGGFPVDTVQNGGGSLQGNDWRPLDFEYRNGYGWTAMTISCNPGSGTVNCVRWAQVDLANAALGPAGSGVYASNGDYRTFPDLAVNHCGDMALGYTKSSSSIWPSVWVTGRLGGDPANTLQAETQVKAGEIAYDAFDGAPYRWGDYTGMTIDPDGLTFWYLGEYSKNTGTTNGRWATYIQSFTYNNCGFAPDFTVDVNPAQANICVGDDAVYTAALTAVGGFSDPVTLSTSGSPGSASFSSNPVVPTGNSQLTISGAAAGSYLFDIIGSSGALVHDVSVSLDVAAAVPGAPVLLSPANGATGASSAPTFSWTNTGADTYTLEVATDNAFNNIIYTVFTPLTSHTMAGVLDLAAVYYWRVSATNSCGDNSSAVSTLTTRSDLLVCNGGPVTFDGGIPAAWSVIDNTAGAGIVWTTTADAACEQANHTNGSGIAACADSDAAGSGSPAYNTELVTNPFNLATGSSVSLTVAAAYNDLGSGDSFAIDIWNGSTWNNHLLWTSDHLPEDVTIDLGAYSGLTGVRARFVYAGNGWDWYAQVDDVALDCLLPCFNQPPLAESLAAGVANITDLQLSWNGDAANYGYHLYSSTQPYFTSATGTWLANYPAGAGSHTEPGAANNGQNSYYLLMSTNCNGSLTAVTKTVGKFEFSLTPGQ